MDSDRAGSEERGSTHAGLEFHGGHLVDSWVASDQVRALSSGEAEVYGIVGWLGTRNLHGAHVRRNGAHRQRRQVASTLMRWRQKTLIRRRAATRLP